MVLQDDSHDMEEVVVTGYQTISRRESASAISTVKAKDIMVQGVGSIDQMLQGRIPGNDGAEHFRGTECDPEDQDPRKCHDQWE